MITRFCQNGWPEKHRLKGKIKKYISVKDELWIKENLLLRGSRIVVRTPGSAESILLPKYILDIKVKPMANTGTTVSMVAGY